MRMVIEVSDELHAAVKEKANSEGRPVSRVVRGMLEQYAHGIKLEVSVDSKPGLYPGSGIKAISKADQAKGRTRK